MKFSMNRLAAGKKIPKIVVLCVDDENYVLQSLKSELIQLFERRYTVEIAESGAEALVKSSRPRMYQERSNTEPA
jgi:CheY-like chemotaxis protein